MAVFTPVFAFANATAVRCCAGRPFGNHLPAAPTTLVASWSLDLDGRLVRRWRTIPEGLAQ